MTSIEASIKGDVEFDAGLLGSPSRQVLEIGCGAGRVALALAARGYSILGVDLSEPRLRLARAKSRNLVSADLNDISFLQHDILELDLPCGSIWFSSPITASII